MSKWNSGQADNNNQNQQQGYEKTRGGLTPDYSRGLDYRITSNEICKYINDMVDTVISAYNKKARETSEVQINTTGQCRLTQIEVSQIYRPFLILIPEEWVITSETLQKPGENSLFYQGRDEDTSKSVSLYPCVKEVLANFFYSKKDVDAFYTPTWKKEHGVANSSSPVLKSFIFPKRYVFKDEDAFGPKSAVMVMLDPIRVLHSMAASPADNGRAYFINNLRTKSHGKGVWGYNFTKVYVNNSKFKKKNMQNKINSFLQRQFTVSGGNDNNRNRNKHHSNGKNNYYYSGNGNKKKSNNGTGKKKKKKDFYYSR